MMTKRRVGKRVVAGLACSCMGLVFAGCSGGSSGGVGAPVGQRNIVLGITAANTLVRFDPTTPNNISAPQTIAGLQPGETLLGIDYRPATGQVYGLGSTNRLYLLNITTNPVTATAVGGPFAVPLAGTSFGFDFNPVPDRIRIVSDADLNLRINPTDGTIVDADETTPGLQLDGTLAYAAGDVNFGVNPNIVAAAYSNNDTNGATGTTNFAIDSNLNILVTQGTREGVAPAVSPNSGQLFTVGTLGVDVTNVIGFDITGSNTALAVFTVAGQANSRLYGINLNTGQATLIGEVGGQQLVGLTFVP